MIKLESFIKEAKILNPQENFKPESKLIEYRINPLTGKVSTILLRNSGRPVEKIYVADKAILEELAKKSEENCFFCPEKIEKSAARFPDEIISGGKLRIGEAYLFSNIAPYTEFSVVTVLTKKHFIRLDEFTPQIFLNGFLTILQFSEKVSKTSPSIKFVIVGMQYLPPAGSSIVHPHMQALFTEFPLKFLDELLENSKNYHEKFRSNFWEDLLKLERTKGERYINRIGNVEWITPYTPVSNYEVWAIVNGKSSFLELNTEDLKNLCEGICKVLKFFEDKNFSSFQFILYSGPLHKKLEYFWINLKIVARPGVNYLYTNDTWFLPFLVQNPVVAVLPEDLAKNLRKYLF